MNSFGVEAKATLAPGRPKCNTILHLFGEWFFEAAFIGCDMQGQHNREYFDEELEKNGKVT